MIRAVGIVLIALRAKRGELSICKSNRCWSEEFVVSDQCAAKYFRSETRQARVDKIYQTKIISTVYIILYSITIYELEKSRSCKEHKCLYRNETGI